MMRADRASRVELIGAGLLAVSLGVIPSACFLSLRVPPDAGVSCAAASECPADLVCVLDIGRCVAADSPCLIQGKRTAAADGTACGDGRVCVAAVCVAAGCGDGFVDVTAGETCEPALDPACRDTCVLPFCGDGVVDDGEECDGTAPDRMTCTDCRLDCGFDQAANETGANCNKSLDDGCECAVTAAELTGLVVRLHAFDGTTLAIYDGTTISIGAPGAPPSVSADAGQPVFAILLAGDYVYAEANAFLFRVGVADGVVEQVSERAVLPGAVVATPDEVIFRDGFGNARIRRLRASDLTELASVAVSDVGVFFALSGDDLFVAGGGGGGNIDHLDRGTLAIVETLSTNEALPNAFDTLTDDFETSIVATPSHVAWLLRNRASVRTLDRASSAITTVPFHGSAIGLAARGDDIFVLVRNSVVPSEGGSIRLLGDTSSIPAALMGTAGHDLSSTPAGPTWVEQSTVHAAAIAP